MKKIYTNFILIFSCILSMQGQSRAEDFEIKLSKKKYPNALYNQIKFIESREDSNDCGFLLVGRNNISTKVVMDRSLNQKFPKLLKALIDSTAKNDSLLFSLDELRFSETYKYDKEVANFKIRATIFCEKGLKSYPIHTIDTLITANFEGDMSYMIMIKASNFINDEITKSLYKSINENNYTRTYLLTKKDSINKSKLPLYILDTLKNGLYKNYAAFKMQQPNSACEVMKSGDTINSVKVNRIALNAEDSVYAIVCENTAYIRINNDFIRVYKRKFDLYFSFDENRFNEDASLGKFPLIVPMGGTGINAAGNAAAGLIGGLIISAIVNNKREKENETIKIITYKINYKNGNPIFFKKSAYLK